MRQSRDIYEDVKNRGAVDLRYLWRKDLLSVPKSWALNPRFTESCASRGNRLTQEDRETGRIIRVVFKVTFGAQRDFTTTLCTYALYVCHVDK